LAPIKNRLSFRPVFENCAGELDFEDQGIRAGDRSRPTVSLWLENRETQPGWRTEFSETRGFGSLDGFMFWRGRRGCWRFFQARICHRVQGMISPAFNGRVYSALGPGLSTGGAKRSPSRSRRRPVHRWVWVKTRGGLFRRGLARGEALLS